MTAPLLEVEDLSVTFGGGGTATPAVRGVSFALGRERLGVVGESGSGKSTMGRAVLGLLPPGAAVTARRLAFKGEDLRGLPPRRWQRLRGRHMTMIMQDPKFSLNPVMTVGAQIAEGWRLHHRGSGAEARRRAAAMLEAVRIADPERVLRLYPHQLSGGMGQRAMIAAMLIAEPEMLIADEAISALDVTVGNEVLGILDRLVAERGMGLVFISHNLVAVAGLCDRVLVMYGGRVVEECASGELERARHPYTRALLAAAPSLEAPRASLATVVRDPAWLQDPLP